MTKGQLQFPGLEPEPDHLTLIDIAALIALPKRMLTTDECNAVSEFLDGATPEEEAILWNLAERLDTSIREGIARALAVA